jgi:hypothetical protein
VCFWEDDPHQSQQPDGTDGANGVSLIEGRETYRCAGAMAPEVLSKVRPPTTGEAPEHGQQPQT